MLIKLADYVRMDIPHEIANNAKSGSIQPEPRRSSPILWGIALLVVMAVVVLAFGAYRQPELLMNLVGLRYCG
ncbi:MAG: hypothetical protein K9J74_05625 [Sulfuritalea sp.]|nr:hypothetical protein [Sulfuritalea sp.]